MSVPIIAFFNNTGGVGKTSLVFHIAHMLAELDFRIVAADLDPQGNLSAAFLTEQRLEEIWPEEASLPTIYGAIDPIRRGIGDIRPPLLEPINEYLALIPGDMGLSNFEDDLSQVWPKCLDRDERSFRVMSAFWRVLQSGADTHGADVVLVDLGPNLGAINRAALIAADGVVVPLGPDLFSIQGLRNFGPRLHAWRSEWQERLLKNPAADLALPSGKIEPLGYIVMLHGERQRYPVKSYRKWIDKIPHAYNTYVKDIVDPPSIAVESDVNCLAMLKHFRSLMPMAQEARKPIFHLKPGDGALGAHIAAVREAYDKFKQLTLEIVHRANIERPCVEP